MGQGRRTPTARLCNYQSNHAYPALLFSGVHVCLLWLCGKSRKTNEKLYFCLKAEEEDKRPERHKHLTIMFSFKSLSSFEKRVEEEEKKITTT
jgi:hypothetical protein